MSKQATGGRCCGCRHWDPDDAPPGWGICHKACGKYNGPYHQPTLAWAGYDDSGGWVSFTHLNTQAEFGCVQFESRSAT